MSKGLAVRNQKERARLAKEKEKKKGPFSFFFFLVWEGRREFLFFFALECLSWQEKRRTDRFSKEFGRADR